MVKSPCLSRMELGTFGYPEQHACESQGAVEASILVALALSYSCY